MTRFSSPSIRGAIACRAVWITVIGLQLAVPGVAMADNLVMPGELVDEAQKLGCAQVAKFFDDRQEMVLPPYAYGYASGDENDSAVFWCQKDGKEGPTYYLAFLFKNNTDTVGNCPRTIEWMNPPGGLSIVRERDRKLSEFIYMDKPKERGPNIYPEHSAVKSAYGGTQANFYCHKGRWLLLQLD